MKCKSRRHHCNSLYNTVAIALFLVLAGMAILGFNLGYLPLPLKGVIFSWPMLLLCFGLITIVKRYHFFSGVVLLSVGVFFVIPRLLVVYPNLLPVVAAEFVHLYWPVLLIFSGILFLIHRLLSHSNSHSKCSANTFTPFSDNQLNEEIRSKHVKNENGYFSKQSVFSSGEHIVLDPEFKGGEINTVLGETVLDLRKTTLKEGDTFLKINTVLGSVTIFVPIDWSVDIRTEAIMYSFEDKRYNATNAEVSKRLVIIGSGILGSGELRN